MLEKSNVFINCPLDDAFFILLKPMIFTIMYMGFTPKIASSDNDCAEDRLTKILAIIRQSKYGIHDLSRMKSKKEKEYFRMNMPFELGLDLGLKKFAGKGTHKNKKFLILEAVKYDYKKTISDISGMDIENHNDDVFKLLKVLRNWFVGGEYTTYEGNDNEIWTQYNFLASAIWDRYHRPAKTRGSLEDMPVNEFITFIKKWLGDNNISYQAR